MTAAQEIMTRDEAEAARLPAEIPQTGSAAIISLLGRTASDPNVDVEKFERLLAAKEKLDAAEARKAFNAAVAAAKGEIPPIIKNRTVDFTSQKGRTTYKHEDLAGIARVVDPILNKHGLSYRFRSAQDGNRVTVTCILSHKDGYFEETSLSGGEDHSGNKNPHQAVGSAATYLQRYTLKLALGLSAALDDDARSAEVADIDQDLLISAEQAEAVRQALKFADADEAKFLDHIKLDAIEDMRAAKFKDAMNLIAERKRRAEAKEAAQ